MVRLATVAMVLSMLLVGCGGAEGDDGSGDDGALDQYDATARYTFVCYGRDREKGVRGELLLTGESATFKDVQKTAPACAFHASPNPPIPCAWTTVHGKFDATYNPRSASRKKMARFLDRTATKDQHADNTTRELFVEKLMRTGGRDLGDGLGGELLFAPTSDANAGFDGGDWSFFCRRK